VLLQFPPGGFCGPLKKRVDIASDKVRALAIAKAIARAKLRLPFPAAVAQSAGIRWYALRAPVAASRMSCPCWRSRVTAARVVWDCQPVGDFYRPAFEVV
jgi:hypothetical protein